jgi:hypothetical protein
MRKKELSDSITRFSKMLLDLCNKYPRLRFNVALPGYILECISPLTASPLRDMAKRGSVEWLCMGYTEPFLSFSPLKLTGENIALGMKTFTELTGEAPKGFVPPFSNWEPSHIDMLNAAGLQYAVVSNALVDKNESDSEGYWITEYTGSAMAVFPSRPYHIRNAPRSIAGWIKEVYQDDKPDGAPRMFVLKFLYPLEVGGDDGQQWVEMAAAEIDKHILELQPLRFKDVLDSTPPLGLHYFPPSLIQARNEPAMPYFLNRLHCHDQISIMQRKLMDVYDCVGELKDSKLSARLKKQLFFAQDINRFLPSERTGFSVTPDRLWTYGKLIDVERELFGHRDAQNGVIRLTDFLRSGYKSVVMENKSLKLYIDHKNGAQAYALDYGERAFNACAAYNPEVRARPRVFVPRESRLWFRDRIFTGIATCEDYRKEIVKDCSNFGDSQFEYIFKNTSSGVKALLNCNGGFVDGDRHCPLIMDKVFGLEKDGSSLSYSYKLGNASLTDYSFRFGIELPLALPGCLSGSARIIAGKRKIPIAGDEALVIESISDWEIEDEEIGVRIEFVTQKNADLWLFSPKAPPGRTPMADCVTLLMSYPIALETNSTAAFTGMIRFKKIRARSANNDSF